MPDKNESDVFVFTSHQERILTPNKVLDGKINEIKDGFMEIAKEVGELKAKNQLTLERIERLEKLFLDHLKTPDAHHPAIKQSYDDEEAIIYLCDQTQDLEFVGLRGNFNAKLSVFQVQWGTNLELQGDGTVNYTLKANGDPAGYVLECRECYRPGCEQCMPMGRGCRCPECEQKKENE